MSVIETTSSSVLLETQRAIDMLETAEPAQLLETDGDAILVEIEGQPGVIETQTASLVIETPIGQGPPGSSAMSISQDANNRLEVKTDGLFVRDDLAPDPLAYYILAKG